MTPDPDPGRRGGAVALPGLLLLLVGAASHLACETSPPKPPPIRPVRVMTVIETGGTRVRTFSGTVRASLESRLSFRVPGTIERVPVRLGQAVRAGDLIAVLDDEEYQIEVDNARASLDRATAQANNARAELERIEGLYMNNNASQNQLDSAETEMASALASARSAAKTLERASLRLGYTRLTAPVAGTIAEVDVEVNENVTTGQVVVVLTSGSTVEVELAVPEVFIAQVREGQAAEVTLDALPGRSFAGAVTEVGVAAGGTATAFPVTVALTDSDPDIRPGMAAEVALSLTQGDGRPRLLVPAHAVGEDRSGHFVYVARPGEEDGFGVVERRAVQVRTNEVVDDRLEITSGLEDGELLVTAGVSRIEDGQTVRLPGSTEAS